MRAYILYRGHRDQASSVRFFSNYYYTLRCRSLEATSEVSAPPMEGVFIDRAVVRKLVMRFEVVTPMSVKVTAELL